jgi:hypothetical protein
MKPTITNAFTVGAPVENGLDPATQPGAASGGIPAPSAEGQPLVRKARPKRGSSYPNQRNRARQAGASNARVPVRTLAAMQVDLRTTDFGTSLELSPMEAIHAVQALLRACPPSAQFLVSMEQAAWRDGAGELSLGVIAGRIGVGPLETISAHQLVMDGEALSALAAMCQPTRLLVIAVDGPIDARDALAMNRAVEKSKSPLTAELRAVAALEVLGDRSVVLHAREHTTPLMLVAENFRHYLAAVLDCPSGNFAAPPVAQVRALMDLSGALTVRPIETEVHSTSIDIGVNTSAERFSQPANVSLVFDRPSKTWHAAL